MAKRTSERRGTKPRPARRPAGRRETPWYRKPATWGWLLGVGVIAGILAFAVLNRGHVEQASEPFVGGDLHSLVASPTESSRLYVGGHEGVAVSTDEGTTWRQLESLDGADAMGWAFSEERILVGGHPGMFVSMDGGRTFETRNEGLPATDIHAVGAGGGVIYAASPAAGVFASTDGGLTWEMRTAQVGQSFMGRILVDPADPEHVVAPDMQFGAVESRDGGRTWRPLGGPQGVMWISWNPDDPTQLVASGMSGAATSSDGGKTWQPITVPAGATIVEVDPERPETMYAAGLEGTTAEVWVSRDGGGTWTRP
ncbi:MAG TPA: sialidase family protein [Actinomycetota bacterium]|nr:sialidase family protein [Actinomycetota bacterium]